MKKVISLCLLLLLPFLVYADNEDKIIKPFEAKVINEKGMDIIGKENKHLNKDDQIIISLELDNETGGTYIDDELYEVAYKDIEPVKKEVGIDDDVYDGNIDYKVVINKDNIDILKGPASIYEKVGSLNTDDEVWYRYYYDPYIYIEKGDIKGWVNARENNIFVESNVDFITTKEIVTTCGKVPVNTVFTTPYIKAIDVYDVMLDYNGCKSVVQSLEDESMVTMLNQYIVNYKKVKIHETPELDSKVVETIPSYKVLTNLAIFYQKFEDENGSGIASPGNKEKYRWYVEYEGKRGWLNLEDFEVFESLDAAKKDANKEKIKSIFIPSIIVLTVVICLLAFYNSSKKKGK